MLIWIVSTLSIAVPLYFVTNSRGKWRVIKLDSPWEQLIWSFRVNQAKYAFPRIIEDWDFRDFDPYRMELILQAWDFLRPFFASRGYTLYNKVPKSADLVPALVPRPAPDALQIYPYARRIAAERTPEISLVSEEDKPSDELKVLQRLNSDKLRSNPRNHTIYALEFVVFDNFVFLVMPRWDTSMDPDFSTVSELMEYSKFWLEVLDFLHEHRIAHQDFIVQNTGINVFGTYDEVRFRKGLRNPGEVRYALYDFGHSVLYPEDFDINSVKTTRFIRFHHGRSPEGPYNPFKADVAMLGGTLEVRVRHIENVVPGLGPFFEQMKEENEEARLSAREALTRFLSIYESLTPSQLETEVTTIRWKNGKAIPKECDG